MTRLTSEQVLRNFASRLVSAWCSDSPEEQIAPAASTLSCFLSSSTDGTRSSTVTLPALELRPPACRVSLLSEVVRTQWSASSVRKRDRLRRGRGRDVSSSPSTIQAKNLKRTRQFDKLDVQKAPSTILRNLIESFQLVIDDKLRWTAIGIAQRSLLRAKAGRIDAASARVQAKILKLIHPPSRLGSQGEGGNGGKLSNRRSSPVRIIAAVSNWATLPPSSSVKGSSSSTSISDSCISAAPDIGPTSDRSSALLVLPLIFEVVIDVDLFRSKDMGDLGTSSSFSLRVPGTISAKFNCLTTRLESAAVVLDTDALYDQLRSRATEIVKKVARTAFAIAPRLLLHEKRRGGDSSSDRPSKSESTVAAAAAAMVPPFRPTSAIPRSTIDHATLRQIEAPRVRDGKDRYVNDDTASMPPPPSRPPRSSPPLLTPVAKLSSCNAPPSRKRQRLSNNEEPSIASLSSAKVIAAPLVHSSCARSSSKMALVNPAA